MVDPLMSGRPGGDGPSLPPGWMGLPLVGETAAFVRDPYRFLEIRRNRHGDVFKSNVGGRRVVFLSGLNGASAFYDQDNIGRDDAHPFLMTDLFGGTNFEMYDGPRHLGLKTIALEAFDRAALANYLPDMQLVIEGWLEHHGDGTPFAAMTALRGLAVDAICRNVIGLEPGPEIDAMTRDYGLLLAGLSATVPVRIPGTTYDRAMTARDRLLARIRTMVEERRARPRTDGLSRILSGTAPDGRTYTDDEAVLEVHHIVVAGFVVYAHLAEVVRRLAVQPDLRARCAEEVAQHASDGPLTMEGLSRAATCTAVVLEAKRFVSLVPLAFGRARRTFACNGFEVPQGWTVWLALHLINHDPSIYADPGRFDPDRFGPGREEHQQHRFAFIPQGSGPPTSHQCLGLEYSTLLTLAFLVLLVRGYDWRLPRQRLRLDRSKRPPEPRDGLMVELRSG
jgi:retinoid hydroxylase